MLPIDVQAEIILSFQDEKRRGFRDYQGRQQSLTGHSTTLRSRLFRTGGGVLISAGQSLQRMAGVLPAGELGGRLGWEK